MEVGDPPTAPKGREAYQNPADLPIWVAGQQHRFNAAVPRGLNPSLRRWGSSSRLPNCSPLEITKKGATDSSQWGSACQPNLSYTMPRCGFSFAENSMMAGCRWISPRPLPWTTDRETPA